MHDLIVFCAKYLVIGVILVAAWAWLKQQKRGKLQMILAALIAGALAYIAAKIAGKLYYDPRPFVTQNTKPLFEHAADNGFPSDHSWFSMAAAAVTYFYNRKLGYLAGAGAIIIGVARVLAHVHSPVDIIGGFAIGIVAGWLGVLAAKKLYR